MSKFFFFIVSLVLITTFLSRVIASKPSLEGVFINTEQVKLENGSAVNVFNEPYTSEGDRRFKTGDRVKLEVFENSSGKNEYIATDFVRTKELKYLFALFVFMAILIGGIWGYTSLIGMAISFAVIFSYILPQINSGQNPIYVAIIGSVFIIPITFYLSHGFNIKTHISVVSTLLSLIATGIIASLFIEITKLTGFSSEEAMFLQTETGTNINIKGLLLAGIIISTLGILDDITISQASVVEELKKANTKYTQSKLLTSSMKVGRDHIASLINTLILVYTGASLPLLLLFTNSQRNYLDIINTEMVATEIVKTLVGSIGVILAVPISSFLAAYYFSHTK